MNLKLSIITVCLNNHDGLLKTIESVIAQTSIEYEFLIVDGGSNDGSAELIKKFEKHISWWVSEPDQGVYNAMNKGIVKAKGEYCLFLNSGDCLASSSVLQQVFSKNYNVDIIYGNLVRRKGKWRYRITRYPDKLSLYHFYARVPSLHHQASFIRRGLFDMYGLYREDLKIVADWEFFLKTIILHQCSTKHLNINISIFDSSGLSSGGRNSEEPIKERILEEYFPMDILCELQAETNKKEEFQQGLKKRITKNKLLFNIIRLVCLPCIRLKEYLNYRYVRK